MTFLCHVNDIACPGSKEFSLEGRAVFVVRKEDGITAFINCCPHTGAPLNWQPHRFLDADNQYIQCDLHMAVFDSKTGQCLAGPCVGDHLQSVNVSVKEDHIFLDK